MAGQSQAANLGGMLSQIGNTLGTSVDSENYVRGTQNMFRPDVEADDIEGQRQLMNWQTKLGRTDEARNTLLGINTLEEKQEKQKKEDGIVRVGQLQGNMQTIVNALDREDVPDSAKDTLRESLSLLQSKLTIEGGAIGQDLSGVGQQFLDERDARNISEENRQRAISIEEERVRQVNEAAVIRADEDTLRKLPTPEARAAFLKNEAQHPSQMTSFVNELNVFYDQGIARDAARASRTAALSPVDLSGYQNLTEADKKSLSGIEAEIERLIADNYKTDGNGQGTWQEGGKALVLDAQKRLSNAAFEMSQSNTREAQDREDEYRNVLTRTLIESTPSPEQILKYADDNNLDMREAADELDKAARLVASQKVTMIAQQKDPASKVPDNKRPLKAGADGLPVHMNDAELEQIRATVIEQRYATGDVKTMPTWDEILPKYIEYQKKAKSKTEAEPKADTYVPSKSGKQRLAELFEDMDGRYDKFVEKRGQTLPSSEDFAGNKRDVNFTGIENLSGTPRPDVRTPEQIENNSGLRTTTNFTGIENLSGTPRPDLRTPEQIENNELLRR